MNKVYLLLRNNNKTGPHSIEELIQLGLKPLDLIWVEGKSFSWSYPSEIGALKPYVATKDPSVTNEPAAKQASLAATASNQNSHEAYMPPEKATPAEGPSAKKVYVSMPANMVQQPITASQQAVSAGIEQKAEELRKRAQAFGSGNKPLANDSKPVVTENKPIAKDNAAQVKYSRAVGELEEDYSSWIYNQKSKKKKNPSWVGIAAAIVAVVLLGAGFAISRYDYSENEPITPNEPVTQQLTETDIPNNNEALIPAPPASEPEPKSSQTVNYENTSSTPAEPLKKDNKYFATNTSSVAVQKKEVRIPVRQAGVNSSVSSPKPLEVEKQTTAVPGENSNKTVAKTKGQTASSTAAAPEKKKTFGAAIAGFFNKFKRKVDVVQDQKDEPKPENKSAKQPVEKPQTTMQDPGTERKTRRRAEETNAGEIATNKAAVEKTNPVEKTNFEDLVDINSNEPAEKWMLGVHGLKITMHNRSNETLRTAAVEVRYYSEQNELLEKKIVNFTNIPPSKSATQPAPDHRLADHTEYRFLSASN